MHQQTSAAIYAGASRFITTTESAKTYNAKEIYKIEEKFLNVIKLIKQ